MSDNIAQSFKKKNISFEFFKHFRLLHDHDTATQRTSTPASLPSKI